VLTAQRLTALLLALAALLFTPRAFATSCEVPQLKTSTERANVIFVGVVAAETPMGGGMGIYRVRVERVFKGSMPATVTVSGGGMKGSTFRVGEQYLVFGRLPEPSAARPPDLFAHLCGGTQLAGGATEWLSTLGAGDPPTGAGTPIVAGLPSDPPPAATPIPPPTSGDAPAAEPARPARTATAPPPADTSKTAVPPTIPVASGGCAGCTSTHSEPVPTASLLLLGLLVLARRAYQRRP
jgi:hypothetical protein